MGMSSLSSLPSLKIFSLTDKNKIADRNSLACPRRQHYFLEIRTFQKPNNNVSYYRNLITEKVEVYLTDITNPILFG
jgi:hypothetical protein